MRRILPQRRAAETFDLRFWNQPFTVTVGFYADGTPGEVFIDSGKTGSDIESIGPRRRRGDQPRLAAWRPPRNNSPRRHPRRVGRARVDFGRGR